MPSPLSEFSASCPPSRVSMLPWSVPKASPGSDTHLWFFFCPSPFDCSCPSSFATGPECRNLLRLYLPFPLFLYPASVIQLEASCLSRPPLGLSFIRPFPGIYPMTYLTLRRFALPFSLSCGHFRDNVQPFRGLLGV